MSSAAIVLAIVGVLVLGGSVAGARHSEIHPFEHRVFRAVNGLPDWLFWPLWVPMQLGNLVVGTTAGIAVSLWRADVGVAVAVVLAMLLKLVTERLLRHRMAPYLAVRQRPGTSEPGAVLRGGDVPESGPSFPSGHVILAGAVACIVVTELPTAWTWVPFLLTGLVMVGRVYVGAHNPLDITAGLGTGLIVGSILAAVFT